MKIVEDVAGKLRQLGFKVTTEYAEDGRYRLRMASARREVALAFPPDATEREVIMGALTMAGELQRAELEALFPEPLDPPTVPTAPAADVPGAPPVVLPATPAIVPDTKLPPAPLTEAEKSILLAAAEDIAKVPGSSS